MKRLLPLLLVLAACTSNGGAATTTDDPSTTTEAAPASTAAESTTTTVMEEPPGIEDLPEALQSELEVLIGITEATRGLDFIDPPVINVVSPEELERLVLEDIAESTEDVEADEALYELLGLVPPDTSLLDLYSSVLGEQVAGFYDPDTDELVVPLRSDTFSALERSTIVHELTHALTDQHFGFGDAYKRLFDEERYDEAAAYQALIEGDAVLTELLYLIGLGIDEQRKVIEESLDIDSSALDAAPRFLQESLIFPYVQGQTFVERLYELEGMEGVNAAYGEPPLSTEQIISPEDYGRDLPLVVEFPDVEVDGYEVAYTSTWGEFSFELMFNQVLNGDSDAADGWGGDEYRVYFDGENVAMALIYTGDSTTDAEELESALTTYVAATITDDAFGSVERAGDQVTLVVADDPVVGQTLADQLAG